MADVLTSIYEAFKANQIIWLHCENRIKYYDYPETGSITQPYIVIDPLDAPMQSDFADQEWLTYTYLIQIDIQSKKRLQTAEIAYEVDKVMDSLGFRQYTGGADQYDSDTGIFRIAHTYRGTIYRQEIIKGEK